MSKYFFNLYNDEVTIDEEGIELPDDATALTCARGEVRYQAAESVKIHGHLILSHRIVICNEATAEIGTITFGDVIDIRS